MPLMDDVFGVESGVYVAIRAVLATCSVLLLGALALRVLVLPRYAGPDAEALRQRVDLAVPRWIDVLGIVAAIATLARLGAQHAAVFGTAVAPSGDSISTLLFRANWGQGWWVALTSALAVTWVAPRLRRRGVASWAFAATAILVFSAAQPLSGHPAADAHPLRAIAIQLSHLIGAGGWLGSLALLTLVAIPAAKSTEVGDTNVSDLRIASLVRAFSPTALVFASVLGLTGVIIAWSNLGSVAALWQSEYGRVLALKLSLLAVVAGTGAYNWRLVLPTLGEAESSAALRRSSLVELCVGLLVLVATSVLVATPMPGE